jgi:hypothetical protein
VPTIQVEKVEKVVNEPRSETAANDRTFQAQRVAGRPAQEAAQRDSRQDAPVQTGAERLA